MFSNRKYKVRNKASNERKIRKDTQRYRYAQRYRQIQILAKITFQNAKVDFPLILFDLHECYRELSFEKNSEILIKRRPEILILAYFFGS